jgi:hypothetical protein
VFSWCKIFLAEIWHMAYLSFDCHETQFSEFANMVLLCKSVTWNKAIDMFQVHHFSPNPTIAHFTAQGKKQTVVALCHAHQVLTIALLIPKITLILACQFWHFTIQYLIYCFLRSGTTILNFILVLKVYVLHC